MRARFAAPPLVLALVAACALAGLTGCAKTEAVAPVAEPAGLNVSAAASMTDLLEETAASFETANNVKITFNFGASGALQKQIEAGAPCDVFVSASPKQVNALVDGGFVSTETTVTFASNDLVIIVPKGNPKGIQAPADLALADKLSTGDPVAAPIGATTQEWLTGLGLWDTLLPKFVFAANAAQNAEYVGKGEVDAGISFKSDAHARTDLDIVYTVPTTEYKAIKYVACVAKSATDAELAARYVAFLQSAAFQRALEDADFKRVAK